jgi:hypothetical protein
MEMIRPAAQPIVDWAAEGQIINDADGLPRRPAILLSWDGAMPDLDGVEFEIRNGAEVVVLRGRTDNAPAGSILVSQNLLPDTAYQARGRYIPSSPRETTWSDWLDCATPDVRFGVVEFDAALRQYLLDYNTGVQRELKKVTDRIGAIVAELDANTQLDKATLQRGIARSAGQSRAFFNEQIDVAVGPGSAIATQLTELGAAVEGVQANIQVRYVADADTLAGALASWSLNATVANEAGDIQAAGAIQVAAYDDGAGGAYAVARLDATRVLIGSATASFVAPFIVDSSGETPVITLNGNLITAGMITAPMIAAGAVKAVNLDADVFTAVNANITNLTAENINSNYAEFNAVYAPTDAVSFSVSATAGPSTVTNRVSHELVSFDYTTVSGLIEISAGLGFSGCTQTGVAAVTGPVSGGNDFDGCLFSAQVQILDESGTLLSAFTVLTEANKTPNQWNAFSVSESGILRVAAGQQITVKLMATAGETIAGSTQAPGFTNWVTWTFTPRIVNQFLLFREPNGVVT